MTFRRILPWLLALSASLLLAGSVPAAVPNGPSPDLVISEVYGAGGNSGSDYPADYVELFNRGTTTVSLAGKSLQYTSATGTGVFGSITILSGTIEPGQYVLVQAGPGPVSPDITLVASMGATAGKVVLANGTAGLGCNSAVSCAANGSDTRIIDLVGYGNANYFEGAGPALGATNTTSTKRNAEGCVETDNNAADFAVSDQDPDNRASPRNPCVVPPGDTPPTVTETNPPSGAANVDRNGNITVTFSEPVTASDGAFVLSCNGVSVPFTLSSNADGTTYTLDPSVTLPADAQCTVTVRAAFVADQDTDDPPNNPVADYVFTFRTTGITGLRIHDIQGRQHLSPYRGLAVVAVPGVVTARRTNGFYYQDPQPDMDPRTSEGIFVFTLAAPPASVIVGEPVTVSGRVTEFRGGCSPSCEISGSPAAAFANLTTTQISTAVVTAATETGTIAPTVVGAGGRVPPVVVIDNDTPDPPTDDPPAVSGNVESKSSPPGVTDPQDPTFDPAEDGIDFHESLEGMLVQINNAVAVSPTTDFSVLPTRPRGLNSEISVLADNGANAVLRTLRGGIIVRALDLLLPQEYRLGDFNPERLILNDPILRAEETPQLASLVDVRDRFTAPIRAIVDYSFGNFKYLVLNLPPVASGGLTPEVTRPVHGRSELSVATYNVENLDPLNDLARMPLIARQIIDNLRSPDLIALVEMQDFDGEGPLGPAGDPTFAALSEAIAAAGGPTYQWRQIDPVHNQDGGVPNGNIRVGFMFRTDRGLSFIDRPGGTAVTPTEDDPALPGAQLTFSPGRIDPENPVWDNSRKPLAGEFRWHGKTVFVVANHFNSKGGDAPVFGRFQEPMRPSEVQRRGMTMPVEDPQRGQAGVVNAWVRRLLAADPRANIVVLGDLNDFHFSETNRVVEEGTDESNELVNLWRFMPEADRYSYIFQGNSQDLDHILVSQNLLKHATLDAVHINSEFWNQLSDHDSLVARLKLNNGGGGDDDEDD